MTLVARARDRGREQAVAHGPTLRVDPQAIRAARYSTPRPGGGCSTGRPPPGGSLHEARQAAVGEDLAVGLARRAVRDLVGLVRDPAHRPSPHSGHGSPGAVVDPEPVAELAARTGRRCAPARASSASAIVVRIASSSRSRCLGRERLRASRTARRARGAARRRRSRARSRRPCAGRAASCGCAACRRRADAASANSSESGSGPSRSSGPSSPGASTHHAALRSCPCSRTSSARPLSKRIRTAAPFGLRPLRRLLDVEPAGLGEVQQRPRRRRRARRSGTSPRRPTARRCGARRATPAPGTTVFSAEKPSGSTPVNVGAPERTPRAARPAPASPAARRARAGRAVRGRDGRSATSVPASR